MNGGLQGYGLLRERRKACRNSVETERERDLSFNVVRGDGTSRSIPTLNG